MDRDIIIKLNKILTELNLNFLYIIDKEKIRIIVFKNNY